MPVDADGRLISPPPIPKGPAEEEVTEANRQAASILMKLLYAARICRFDLLRSINNLARKITAWTKKEDALLHHLMAYVHQSKHHLMIGWVGDSMESMEDSSIGLFADADYAGCGESLKTTSGAHLHIQGPRTRFPLAGLSKRQGCLSHSTPEAEIVAADFAMMRWGLPAITLWQQLGGKDPDFGFYDDNQTMIGMVRTGKNPTMRHLERTHGSASVGCVPSFRKGMCLLPMKSLPRWLRTFIPSLLRTPISWTHACQLINIFPPDQIGSRDIMDLMRPTHPQSTDEKRVSSCTRSRVKRPVFPTLRLPSFRRCFITLPLRFNGRPDRNRISYLGLMVWTRIIEEVWEDRPQKMREREGYGKAIVPHVTELQDCKNGLVIEFYDSAKDLVHVYKDEGNRLQLQILIFRHTKGGGHLVAHRGG